MAKRWFAVLTLASLTWSIRAQALSVCPGYAASNVRQTGSALTADLSLNGKACDIYGTDLANLTLSVQYQTSQRLHVQIYDRAEQVYQVPSSVVSRPDSSVSVSEADSELRFVWTENPFSFAVQRISNNETIFNTSGSPLVFENQYINVRTSLPRDPYLYGLGEDTDPFRLNTTNYTRTLWSRDAYLIPTGTNLYSNHPIYFEHRVDTGNSHGVFLLNSNGMDIKINNTDGSGQYLEYNTLGGIVDLYFLAGPSPAEVAQQYSEIIGRPTQMAYWTHGFHQCRYGMQDVYEVADVVVNYSAAGIPLETMWTDIDYMDLRKVFTLDTQRYPLHKVRELVQYLHDHQQNYIVMVDPAVAYQDYATFNQGKSRGAFLMNSSNEVYQGVVWPGITAFPDWFAPNTQQFWTDQFARFFDAQTGIDIDGLWIDMNEASNFCPFPCSDPAAYAKKNGDPPVPPPVRQHNPQSISGWPVDFQPPKAKRAAPVQHQGLPNRDLVNPPYKIQDAAGSISNLTLRTDLIHANGLVEYDTHNLYGTMMSVTSYNAMLHRRPSVRPLIITRSTFAGAGRKVGHWLGDNSASWHDYHINIVQAIQFASLYQLPMVGADVCGYGTNTTQMLCSRWAMLGAFMPFYRSHQSTGTIDHEFYRWPDVAAAAKKAINARYILLDYLYTGMWEQSTTGTPSVLLPMWFNYPNDTNTLVIDTQFFFGRDILVSPVIKENATDVSFYLPQDTFYDFWTSLPVQGNASTVHQTNVGFNDIPVHIRGGSIIPMRMKGTNTTAMLRKENFKLVIAPGAMNGDADGTLYLDDGGSINQPAISNITFRFIGSSGQLSMSGTFDYQAGVLVEEVQLLGVTHAPSQSRVVKRADAVTGDYNATSLSVMYQVNKPLTTGFSIALQK